MLPRNVTCAKSLFCIVSRNKVPAYHLQIQVAHFHIETRASGLLVQSHKLFRVLRCYESTAATAAVTQASDTVEKVAEVANATAAETVVDLSQDIGQTVSETVDTAAVAEVILNKLGEPTLSSMGLAKWYTPPGILQNLMEFIHVTLEVPWWVSICSVVVIIRLLMFPLIIKAQQQSTKMANVMPRLQELQNNVTLARTSGDTMEAFRAMQQLGLFVHTNDVKPMKSFLYSGAQGPIFLSFFIALRAMANLPVESMQHGGASWFPDLTIPDQYYLLPTITCTTLWITLELATGGGKGIGTGANFLTPYITYGIKILPFIVFPFIMNFPSAVLVYWASNNFVSLIQVSVLKVPVIRDYFKIQQRIKYDKTKFTVKKKGLVKDIKQAYTNMKLTKEVEDRERLDQIAFQRAGRAPPVKTYKSNPTTEENRAVAKGQ